MLKFEVVKNTENAGSFKLIASEGAHEYFLVETNYKMIIDWLKSNLEFKEARVEQMKNRMDAVAIHKTRTEYMSSLVEEARVSALSKEQYFFRIVDTTFIVPVE